jgi:hypothetical protein
MAAAKKKENSLEDVALVAGTQQNLSNLYSLDIYGSSSTLFTFMLGSMPALLACPQVMSFLPS